MTEQSPVAHGALPTIPAGWPVHTLAEIRAELCAPGMPFEMETVTIRGVPTRVWKNALPNLRGVMAAARTHGAADFVVYGEERVTFDAFHRAVAALMAALQARGVGKGDRVALAMRNLPEWPVVFMAVTALGAIIVPLNAWWTGEELAFALEDSGAKLLVADADRWGRIAPHASGLPLERVIVSRGHAEGAERLEDLIGAPMSWATLPDAELPAAAIDSDDPAGIFYTSGTTGRPKGALGTHRNLVTNIMTSAWSGAQTARRRGEGLPEAKRRVILLAVPLFHATAYSATLMGTLAGGSCLVLLHKWDTLEAMRLIEKERVSMTGGVPFIAWQLIEHPDQYAALQADPGLVPNAVEEIMRFRNTVIYLRRTATRDLAFAGESIRQGDKLACVISAANRDEKYFERPDVFDIRRDPAHTRRHNRGFGFGPHFCVGHQQARTRFTNIAQHFACFFIQYGSAKGYG